MSLIVACCASCSHDAPQPPQEQAQAVSASEEDASNVDESLPASTVLSPSVSDRNTSSTNTKVGSSSHDGSSSKHPEPTKDTQEPPGDASSQVTTTANKEWQEEMQQVMSPSNDGWDTEVFSEEANKQLKYLGKLMVSGHSPTGEDLSKLLSEEFSCTALRPTDRQQVFADQSVIVERPEQLSQTAVHFGAEGLIQAMEDLTFDLESASDKYYKFKLFRVTPLEQQVETTSYFEISGRVSSGAIQRSTTWRCRWEPGDPDDAPRLLSITVEDYEEVKVQNSNQALFSDCTESIFQNVAAYNEQFRHSIDYWRARIESYLGIYYDGHHGVAIGDVNGDGLDDVYLCEPGCLPNRLLVQTPEGLLSDVSEQSGINLLDPTRMALFVDLDNDGDQDLMAPLERHVQFFSNDGRGRFRRESKFPIEGTTAYALSAADYDMDGDVDVYVCFYHGSGEDESNRSPAPIPYHDARSGGLNHLLRNEGNWQFRDVTEEVGLDHNNDRWSYAAAWEDYDNDGDQDLYVANDFGRNNLYRQENGHFTDVAGPANVEDMNFGMSASFGDYNRDGWMDIYVSNMFSAAGGRIAYQPEFQTEGTDESIAALQRAVAGNSLLENVGDGTFRDVSSSAHVGVGRWAWGSLFADINNDGWEDILVANGFVTGDITDDL